MTTTPDLIASLASGLKPAPRGFVARRLGLGLIAGAAVVAAIVLIAWGLRPDFASAIATPPFWVKLAFTGLLLSSGALSLWHLARPDGRVPRVAWLGMAVAVLGMIILAATQLVQAAPPDRVRLLMGSTAAVCPWLIMLLALPVYAGVLWAMRAMAPTRLRLAGAAAGLAAGACSALLYAFACDEGAMPFVLVWYGLGMAVPVIVGALLGPRLLRW